jgi:NAD(P)-dependent dehydrogenase (short-subunit alcohol dehydrogenase family)
VGRATVRRLAEVGYDVGILARGRAGLGAAARDVVARGRRALAIATDVADAEAVERAADRVEAELGPIDVWINVAMTTIFAPLSEIGAAEFQRATDVTYLGQVHGTMAALRRMRPRGRGVIVSVGSALAFRSIALQSPYCGAKFACRGFHGAVRAELRHERSDVRVAQVHLPAVDTPQFGWCRNRLDHQPMPVPPIYPPELCARVIVAVAQRPRRQRIIGWWNRGLIQLDKVAPGVLDHFAARATWEGQQTGEPADDRGATGAFGDQDGGMLEPAFIRSIPGTVRDGARAAASRCREVAADWLGRSTGYGSRAIRRLGPADRLIE